MRQLSLDLGPIESRDVLVPLPDNVRADVTKRMAAAIVEVFRASSSSAQEPAGPKAPVPTCQEVVHE